MYITTCLCRRRALCSQVLRSYLQIVYIHLGIVGVSLEKEGSHERGKELGRQASLGTSWLWLQNKLGCQ